MKIFGYIIALLLGILGFLLFSLSGPLNEISKDPHNATILGLVFMSWGLLLKEYIQRNYRGGPTSVIGSILLGFGIFAASGSFTLFPTELTVEQFGAIATPVLLIISGVILVVHGHRIHKLKETYNKSINADTKPHA